MDGCTYLTPFLLLCVSLSVKSQPASDCSHLICNNVAPGSTQLPPPASHVVLICRQVCGAAFRHARGVVRSSVQGVRDTYIAPYRSPSAPSA